MPHKITNVKEQSNSHCTADSLKESIQNVIFSVSPQDLCCVMNSKFVRCELSKTISSTLQYGEYKIQL